MTKNSSPRTWKIMLKYCRTSKPCTTKIQQIWKWRLDGKQKKGNLHEKIPSVKQNIVTFYLKHFPLWRGLAQWSYVPEINNIFGKTKHKHNFWRPMRGKQFKISSTNRNIREIGSTRTSFYATYTNEIYIITSVDI